jgi:hypothetical protein
MFVLKKTSAFRVLDYVAPTGPPPYVERASDLVAGLVHNGAYFPGQSLFSKCQIEAAQRSVYEVIRHLVSNYSGTSDEFADFDKEFWSVVRTPRINPGKHNIHFDPYESEQHRALAALAEQAGLAEMLTRYQREVELVDTTEEGEGRGGQTSRPKCVSLRETGLSLTAPSFLLANAETSRPDAEPGTADRVSMAMFGNGMELHSDGPRGENTMLMSFESISFEQGPLLLSPGSHNDYIDGTGHRPEKVTQLEQSLFPSTGGAGDATGGRRAVQQYMYRAGEPMVIDSRTLHGALPNKSSKWRVICWYIFEYV